MKGLIISIEGTDGAGKHTQQQLLFNDLKELGYPVVAQSFPDYDSEGCGPVKMYLNGEFGKNSNSLDAYQASALYAVDRLCTYQKALKEHYENGSILLFDRYVQSNFIHQCSKIDEMNKKLEFIKWEEDFEYGLLKLPKPDLIFFIEMPVEKSIELAKARAEYKSGENKDIHEEDTEYMTRSYNNGLSLAKQLGWNIIHCVDKNDNIKHIEDIHKEIMEIATEFLKSQTEEK